MHMYERTTGQFAKPEAIVSHFHLREGDRVADLGAGSGHYMKPLAAAVGRSGLVYLCEVQKNLVEALGAKAQAERITNARPIWGDIEVVGGTKLDDASLDAVLLSNTLFQVSDKQSLLQEVKRILRGGGKLFIIDWSESFGGMGPAAGDVIEEYEAKAMVQAQGFSFDRSFPAGEHHYGLAFRK